MAVFGLLTWAATTTVGQLPTASPMPSGSNVLVGRVLDVAGDEPIAGAVVTLIGYFDAPDRPAARLPSSWTSPLATSPRSVLTSADGYFLFRDLPAGRFSLDAAAFGYASISYPLHVVELTDGVRPVSVPVRLSRLGSISGTVIDEQGEPVVGVPVTALSRSVVGGSLVLRYESSGVDTDDRGAYRIAQLPPGNYVIGVLSTMTSLPAGVAADVGSQAAWGPSFRNLLRAGIFPQNGDGIRVGDVVLQQPGPAAALAPDGRLLAYATALAPGTSSAADATVVALGSGESRTAVDVTVRFAPTVTVSGVLTGPNGPVGTAAVRLEPVAGTDKIEAYAADLNRAGVATALTDAAGVFTFPAVLPGQYVLESSLMAEATSDSPAVSLWAQQPLTVGVKGISGVAVTMLSGVRLSGRIQVKGGTTPMPPGTQGLVVGLRPIGAGYWRNLPARITSGTTFTTIGDPPGRYTVFAMAPPEWTLESVSRGGRTLPDDVLDLETEDVTDLVVTFSRKATRVAGTIADSVGAPDADTAVVVFPADTALWREGVFNNRRVRQMPATSSAAFEFNGLAPGDYYIAAISARISAGWQDPLFLERLVSGATKFTLAAEEDRTLALKTIVPGDR